MHESVTFSHSWRIRRPDAISAHVAHIFMAHDKHGLQHFQFLTEHAALIIQDFVQHLDRDVVKLIRGNSPKLRTAARHDLTIEGEYASRTKSILNSIALRVESHADNVRESGLDGLCTLLAVLKEQPMLKILAKELHTLRNTHHELCARFCHGTVLLLLRILNHVHVASAEGALRCDASDCTTSLPCKAI